MPTPESELFLKKKPTVPPTFEGVDFRDYNAVTNARDAIIREQWVKSMMQRLVEEELGKCYRREGINHLEKCGKYRGTSLIMHLDHVLMPSQIGTYSSSKRTERRATSADSRTTSLASMVQQAVLRFRRNTLHRRQLWA
jgi:hypothetical protein